MATASLKIDNARYVITVDGGRRIIRDGAILIEGGRIREVGKATALAGRPADRVIDARHLVVTPGFVNGHMHISYGHVVRGIFPDDAGSPLVHVFNLQTAMTEEEEYTSTLLGVVELLKSGTVCFVDPGSTKYPDACLQAYADSGIRVILGECVSDREAPFTLPRHPTAEAVKRSAAFIDKWHGRLDGRLRAWAMPFSPETCSAELLRGIKRLVDERGTMLTLHHGSGPQALADYRKRHDTTPTEYLEKIGVLGQNVCLAHSLGVEASEIACMARTGCAALGVADDIGSIEVGKKADLVLFDTQRPEWQALFNPVNNLVYNADGRSVHTVIVDGRVVIDAYRQSFADEGKLFGQAQEIGERLLARTGVSFPRSRWPVV